MTYKTKFIIDDITYYETSINGKVSYTKLEGNKEIPISKEELSYFQNNFKSYLSFFIADYYLSRNNTIDPTLKKLLRPILTKVENIIPIPYSHNFYENLKTLKIVLSEEENFKDSVKHLKDEMEVVAFYNSKNTLVINKSYFQDYILKNDNEESIYTFQSVIFHELTHMSSAVYDAARRSKGIGFWMVWDGYNNKRIKYESLNEGYTQLLTSIYYPNGINKTNYSITVLLMNELMQIVGKDVLDKCFYEEHSIRSIINELCKYIPNAPLSEYLLDNIDKVYNNRFDDKKTYCLREAQYVMGRYFKSKMAKAKIQGISESVITNKIARYRSSLITKEKLEFLNINPQKYLDIEETLNDFDKWMNPSEPAHSKKM